MRKGMKNVAAMVLGLALAGAVLAGCGESQPPQDTPADIEQETGQDDAEENVGDAMEKTEPEVVEESLPGGVEESETGTAEEIAQESEKYEDNFAVDREAAKAFAQKIKDATAKKDLEALAELTAFPVYVGLPDVDVVETKEDFLKLGAETVFTEELMKSVEMADIDNFQPCMAGFSVSDGTANINFGVADGVLAINGINY